MNAALALAWLGSPKAIEVLNRELTSKREPVRKAVESALETVRSAAVGSGARRDAMEEDPSSQPPGPQEPKS